MIKRTNRKMTLEERITRLERLLKNEKCGRKFESSLSDAMEAVEDWFFDHFDSNSFSDDDERMEVLTELSRGRDDISVDMCMDEIGRDFQNVSNFRSRVVNKLKKLAKEAAADMMYDGYVSPDDPHGYY